MPKNDGTMTKAEAKREVQKLLAQAEGLLEQAGKIMDEHQFSATFQEKNYFPRGLESVPYFDGDDDDEDGLKKAKGATGELAHLYWYKDSYEYLAGKWRSSSDWREC